MRKKQSYRTLVGEINAVLDSDQILSFPSRLMLVSSMLYNSNREWIFCGFYMARGGEILEIGPYQSRKLPCTHISYGKGVCGESASKKIPIIVDDVKQHSNYISCDSDTESEIVIPLIRKSALIGVLDIDSKQVGAFDNTDLKYLSKILKLI